MRLLIFMELKYIVTDKDNFAIFSPNTEHKNLSQGLYGKPIGAGFCTIRPKADSEDINVHCYGQSLSLHISSREEDETIINYALNPKKD